MINCVIAFQLRISLGMGSMPAFAKLHQATAMTKPQLVHGGALSSTNDFFTAIELGCNLPAQHPRITRSRFCCRYAIKHSDQSLLTRNLPREMT